MSQKLQIGDRVAWNTAQGITYGVVEQLITEKTIFMGHTFNASDENPYYLVKSAKSGKNAIHKREALKKLD